MLIGKLYLNIPIYLLLHFWSNVALDVYAIATLHLIQNSKYVLMLCNKHIYVSTLLHSTYIHTYIYNESLMFLRAKRTIFLTKNHPLSILYVLNATYTFVGLPKNEQVSNSTQ